MTDQNTKNSDEGRAVPWARIGSAAATVGGGDFAADGGRKPEYSVPGRSPEYNRRVAGQNGFDGRRCVRSGPPSQLNLDESPEAETNEIVGLRSRLEKMTPEIGSGRVESAEFYVRAQVAAIELVGGRVAERILHPDLPPLPAEHDQAEVRAFAAVACAAQGATGALIAYAETEAEALLRALPVVVTALVDAIVEKGTLIGAEVDMIIMQAMVAEGLAWASATPTGTVSSDPPRLSLICAGDRELQMGNLAEHPFKKVP
jgi:hypothetical protein